MTGNINNMIPIVDLDDVQETLVWLEDHGEQTCQSGYTELPNILACGGWDLHAAQTAVRAVERHGLAWLVEAMDAAIGDVDQLHNATGNSAWLAREIVAGRMSCDQAMAIVGMAIEADGVAGHLVYAAALVLRYDNIECEHLRRAEVMDAATGIARALASRRNVFRARDWALALAERLDAAQVADAAE